MGEAGILYGDQQLSICERKRRKITLYDKNE